MLLCGGWYGVWAFIVASVWGLKRVFGVVWVGGVVLFGSGVGARGCSSRLLLQRGDRVGLGCLCLGFCGRRQGGGVLVESLQVAFEVWE